MGVIRNGAGPLRYSTLKRVGSVDGVVFWDRTDPPKVQPDSTDYKYTIQMEDRHDALANKELASSQYGWVIMERNNDLDPEESDMRLWPNDFVPGITISIPQNNSLERRGII